MAFKKNRKIFGFRIAGLHDHHGTTLLLYGANQLDSNLGFGRLSGSLCDSEGRVVMDVIFSDV